MLQLNATAWKSSQLMNSQAYEINYYRDKDFKTVSLHSHDFYELYYFIRGAASYIIGNGRYRLQPGDILLVSPSDLHQLDISDSSATYERIVLWLNPRYMENLSSEKTDLSVCFRICTRSRNHLVRDAVLSERVGAELMDLYGAPSSEFGSDVAAEIRIRSVLLALCRHLLTSGEKSGPARSAVSDSAVSAAVDYIDANLSGDLSLDALAENLFVSKYHLAHLFKDETGVTPHQFIIKKRLLFSKQLIRSGMPVNEVCLRCGFSDYTHFFRAFKQEYGITPKQYLSLIGS